MGKHCLIPFFLQKLFLFFLDYLKWLPILGEPNQSKKPISGSICWHQGNRGSWDLLSCCCLEKKHLLLSRWRGIGLILTAAAAVVSYLSSSLFFHHFLICCAYYFFFHLSFSTRLSFTLSSHFFVIFFLSPSFSFLLFHHLTSSVPSVFFCDLKISTHLHFSSYNQSF